MARPADAGWAQSLHQFRVTHITDENPSWAGAKLAHSRDSPVTTLNGLGKDDCGAHPLGLLPAVVPSPGASAFPSREERSMIASLAEPDTLAASLQRTGVAGHHSFVTRRDQRQRAEVPIGQAGTAFDSTMAREEEAWPDLAVYTEVPFVGQRFKSTRWALTVKEP